MSSTQTPTFSDFTLKDSVRQSIREAGFDEPTPIQAGMIPPALEGKDVIGIAQTGTGKTAAFALPIIDRLANRMELGALVLSPTRELAAQITAEFERLGAHSGIRVATIVGGVKMEEDAKALGSWPNVLVATPGRLNDHIENDRLVLSEIEVLVVDEADRMHDMGFIPQIRRIIEALPEKRQTLMVTATMPDDVEQIARRSMQDAERVKIGMTAPAHRAHQELIELSEKAKSPTLQKLLRAKDGRTLVFARTKRTVDRMTRVMRARGFRAAKIHGDLSQGEREAAMAGFRDGSIRVLLATDIAARGLDVTGIEHVINFDFPHHPEDYVHRVGRTARVDASGLATSFITPDDRRHVGAVRKIIGDKLPQPTRMDSYDPSTEGRSKKGSDKGGGRGRRRRKRGGGRRSRRKSKSKS